MSVDFDTAVKQEVVRLSALHPTPQDIPGCMTLLDDFFRCHVLGSQLRSIYRYGHMAKCSGKFDDFKFCLSLKAVPEEEKRMAWIQRRAEWWARRRLNRSSENVWDMRTEPLSNYPLPPSALFEAIKADGESLGIN